MRTIDGSTPRMGRFRSPRTVRETSRAASSRCCARDSRRTCSSTRRRAATAGRAWRRQAALAAIELSILGLLVAFMIINPSSVHFLIGWALPFGFFVAGLSALRAFMWRGLVRRGERLLRDGVILDTSPEGREGESLAYARDIWRTVDRGASARDLGALEHTADSVVHWAGGPRLLSNLAGGLGAAAVGAPRAPLACAGRRRAGRAP